MRTTINIATPVFKELKALRDKEGGTLGDIVSRLLAEALKTRRVSTERPELELEWGSKPMRARLDLDDKEAVYAILDDPP